MSLESSSIFAPAQHLAMTLMMNKVDKNSVYFRFSSEGKEVQKIEFYGKEIAVGDLKQAIADKLTLPKLDLQLVNEATNEVYKKDGKMLPRNIVVTIRRCPLQKSKRPSVVHVENVDVWDNMALKEEAASKAAMRDGRIEKHNIPEAYLCPLCRDLFSDPHIALCCGRSACKQCLRQQTPSGGREASAESVASCPICGAACTNAAVPNPRLAATVSSLNLDYFVLPNSSANKQDVKLEQVKKEEPLEKVEHGPVANIALPVEPSSQPPSGRTGNVSSPDAFLAFPWPPTKSRASPLMSVAPVVQPPSPSPPAGFPGAAGTFMSPPGLPPGMSVRPCMLSQEQFLAWQQSLREPSSYSDSASEERESRRRRRGRGHRERVRRQRSRVD